MPIKLYVSKINVFATFGALFYVNNIFKWLRNNWLFGNPHMRPQTDRRSWPYKTSLFCSNLCLNKQQWSYFRPNFLIYPGVTSAVSQPLKDDGC